jgi:hypothetical protein
MVKCKQLCRFVKLGYLVSAVASQVGVTRVVRPGGAFKLVALADLIEQDMEAM